MKSQIYQILLILSLFLSSYAFSDSNPAKGSKLTVAVVGNAKDSITAIEAQLLNSEYLQLVERNSIEKLYKEMKLGQQGFLKNDAFPEMGKFLGAYYLVIVAENGSFKLVQTETSRILGSWGTTNPENLKNLNAVLEIQSCLLELVNLSSPGDGDIKFQRLSSSATQSGAAFGEKISFETIIRSSKFAKVHLTILAYFSDGQLLQLFPNQHDPDNSIPVNKKFTFPPENAKYKVIAGPPAGIDKVVFIASEKSVGLPAKTPYIGGIYQGQNEDKFTTTKGLKLQLNRMEDGKYDVKSLELEIKP